MTQHPEFTLKIIYSKARVGTREKMEGHLRVAMELRKNHPDLVAGFDIVAEEDGNNTLSYFVEQLLNSRQRASQLGTDLPFFFHAGESKWNSNHNILDSILLGTRRIGHGFALNKHPRLMELVKQRGIALEICPISNQTLGYVADLRNHPAAEYASRNLPMVLASDDPGMMRYVFTADFYVACVAWDLDLKALKRLAQERRFND